MQYRKLPKGAEQISVFGIGTSSIQASSKKEIEEIVNMGYVLIYGQIYEKIWGEDSIGDENNFVGCHIRSLRRKCSMPHLDETAVKVLFLKAANAIFGERDSIREDCEAVKEGLYDTSERGGTDSASGEDEHCGGDDKGTVGGSRLNYHRANGKAGEDEEVPYRTGKEGRPADRI